MIPQVRRDANAYELHRALVQGCPLLDGVEVDVSTAAATTVQSAPHRLGRAYRGGFVVRAGVALPLTVLTPVGQADPAARVYFRLSSAVATDATLWVY